MKPMAGELGVWLLGDKQIGGFKAWTAIVLKQPYLHTIVKVSGYWVLETLFSNTFLTRFYVVNGQSLDLVLEREAIVNVPEDSSLDTFILKPIEITFANDFDWRNL